MTKRASIYMGETLNQLIEDLQRYHGGQRSTVINIIADRYAAMIRHATPTLKLGQWLALCDVLNGYITDDIERATLGVHWNLSDGLDLEIKDKYDDVDEDFVNVVRSMSFSEKTAIIHVVERFWSGDHNNKEDWREVLGSCGAKLA